MTIAEYNSLINQLPETLFKEYGFNEPFDFSGYKCVHTDEYDYYPEIQCVIIGGVAVIWDSDMPYADPSIPEHFAEMKKRIAGRLSSETIGIVHVGTTNHEMKCMLCGKKASTAGLTALPFDNAFIYYDKDEIDLARNKDMQLLAKCLFASKRYDAEYIIPYKDTKPNEWGC